MRNALAGRLRSRDGVEVVVTVHAAKRYRERVEQDLPGWPEAMARLRWQARREGVVVDDKPTWYPEREGDDRGGSRWLLVGDAAFPLRGRKQPRATTCLTASVPEP